jgi:ribonuclease P protein component
VLPAVARLTRRDEFTCVLRRGRRAGRTLVVMHALIPDPPAGPDSPASPRVGLVVSKAVGGSVVRHRVARRLRHLMAERLDLLPAGTRIVLRALPRSAGADSARLGRELDRALRTLLPAGNPPAGATVTATDVTAPGSTEGR